MFGTSQPASIKQIFGSEPRPHADSSHPLPPPPCSGKTAHISRVIKLIPDVAGSRRKLTGADNVCLCTRTDTNEHGYEIMSVLRQIQKYNAVVPLLLWMSYKPTMRLHQGAAVST